MDPMVGITFATSNEDCEICLEHLPPSKMKMVGDCGHSFCEDCMKMLIKAKLEDKSLLTCPSPGCKFEMDPALCFELTPLELQDSMHSLLKLTHISIGDRIYCSNPNCSNLMSSRDWDTIAGSCKCTECGFFTCVRCRQLWDAHLVSCDPFKADSDMEAMATTQGWKPCPRCKFLIEKTQGCSFVTCRCGQRFCYTCGVEAEKNCSCMHEEAGMEIDG